MNSGDVSGECLFIVGFELFFDLYRMLILISHLLDHFRLLNLLSILLSLQILPLMFLIS